jgi:hypothetical protein
MNNTVVSYRANFKMNYSLDESVVCDEFLVKTPDETTFFSLLESQHEKKAEKQKKLIKFNFHTKKKELEEATKLSVSIPLLKKVVHHTIDRIHRIETGRRINSINKMRVINNNNTNNINKNINIILEYTFTISHLDFDKFITDCQNIILPVLKKEMTKQLYKLMLIELKNFHKSGIEFEKTYKEKLSNYNSTPSYTYNSYNMEDYNFFHEMIKLYDEYIIYVHSAIHFYHVLTNKETKKVRKLNNIYNTTVINIGMFYDIII